MAWRKGRPGRGDVARIEVLPADELPAGVAAPARRPVERDKSGRFLPGDGVRDLGREGARALVESRQLGRLLGVWEPEVSHEYHSYHRLTCDWRDAQMATLAATVGGGSVGPGPASIVATAALQLGASRYLHDQAKKTGNAKQFIESSSLGNDSRQNLLAAHELCAREAKAKPKNPQDWARMLEAAKRPATYEPKESTNE